MKAYLWFCRFTCTFISAACTYGGYETYSRGGKHADVVFINLPFLFVIYGLTAILWIWREE